MQEERSQMVNQRKPLLAVPAKLCKMYNVVAILFFVLKKYSLF